MPSHLMTPTTLGLELSYLDADALDAYPESIIGAYLVCYRPETPSDRYPWVMLELETGEVYEGFAKEKEALKVARKLVEEADAEAKEERLSDLRSAINEAIEDVSDEAKLAAILTLIRGK